MRPALRAAGVRPPGVSRVNGNKETVFVKGILPQAMQEGQILQMDEVDAMQPEVGFILQQILEPHGRLLLTDTGEDISPHPDFRLALDATRCPAANRGAIAEPCSGRCVKGWWPRPTPWASALTPAFTPAARTS